MREGKGLGASELAARGVFSITLRGAGRVQGASLSVPRGLRKLQGGRQIAFASRQFCGMHGFCVHRAPVSPCAPSSDACHLAAVACDTPAARQHLRIGRCACCCGGAL